MTRIIKKLGTKAAANGARDTTASRPATPFARDPLAYAAALKILG